MDIQHYDMLPSIFEYLDATKPEIYCEETNPLTVTIKEGQIDTSRIIEYNGEESYRRFEFRPTEWSQFIGQDKAKERAKTIIKKHHKNMQAHFLVDGIKGHGKTTYVELIAKELNADLIKKIGKQITVDNVVDIINQINSSKNDTVMLFVDEFDTTDKTVIKIFNPIIESFTIDGKKIKPFIFAGATINKHILIKNNPDALDRIKTHVKFTRYNSDEMYKILNQYKEQLYPSEKITCNEIEMIAENSKFNPRTAIGLLEERVVESSVEQVLKNCEIIKDGLTDIDVRILKFLKQSNRAIGANALSMKVGLSQEEYLREFEPYLIEYGYINRVPSRILSEKAKEFLNSL